MFRYWKERPWFRTCRSRCMSAIRDTTTMETWTPRSKVSTWVIRTDVASNAGRKNKHPKRASHILLYYRKRYQSRCVNSTERGVRTSLDQLEDKTSTSHRYGGRPVTLPADDRRMLLPYSYFPGPTAYSGTRAYPLTFARSAGVAKKWPEDQMA